MELGFAGIAGDGVYASDFDTLKILIHQLVRGELIIFRNQNFIEIVQDCGARFCGYCRGWCLRL